MMLSLISASSYTRRLWKNGGGLTHEIAADVFEGTELWRVSLATIERDGPFSDFRGYDRTIVALDPGVELDVDGRRVVLERNVPFVFAGEARVVAYVRSGPTRDLNVVTLRDEFLHDMEIVTSPQRFVLDEDEIAFVYAIEGTAAANGLACTAGDTLVFDGEEAVDVTTAACAAVIRITER